ncbi:unnamed protein product [Pleuronectes platessa]|uniref:Uncharacterized protein n=1 Tax=Pleuronectes platessa TaxID=8262 RepID=A0A9N7USZ5_PLEPL|nr:unnamed protein product [Pleuronectes platessa]
MMRSRRLWQQEMCTAGAVRSAGRCANDVPMCRENWWFAIAKIVCARNAKRVLRREDLMEGAGKGENVPRKETVTRRNVGSQDSGAGKRDAHHPRCAQAGDVAHFAQSSCAWEHRVHLAGDVAAAGVCARSRCALQEMWAARRCDRRRLCEAAASVGWEMWQVFG